MLVAISVFDLVVILMAVFGLVFLLGVQWGRASAWREGLLNQLREYDAVPIEEPVKPPSERNPREPQAHREDRKPPDLEGARGINGGPDTKVVGRHIKTRRYEDD